MTNIFRKAAEAYRNAVASWKETTLRTHMQNLRETFYIAEKDGRIFILHNGVAVASFEPTEQQSSIVAALNNCRQTAVAFEYRGLLNKSRND